MSVAALTSLDLMCILICSLSGIIGFKRGAIKTLISFGGFIASFVMAWIFSPLLADWLIQTGVLNSLFATINVEAVSRALIELGAQQSDLTTSLLGDTVSNMGQAVIEQGIATMTTLIIQGIAKSISFGIIVSGVSVLCWILQIISAAISKVPVIGTFNHLAGMLLGVALGGAIIAVMLWLFSVINLSTGGVWALPTVENSSLIKLAVPLVLKNIGIH